MINNLLTGFYDGMKIKEKNMIQQKNNMMRLLFSLITMFEYEGLPDSLPPVYIEKSLILCGQVGISDLHGDKLIAFECSDGVNINDYGEGTHLVGATALHSYDCEIGKSCVWGWNNSLCTPDIDVWRVADLLTQINISLDFNLKWARLNPIPVAKSKAVKNAIQSALDKIFSGKMGTIMSDNLLSNIDGQPSVDTINLTDVSTVDKIQYLCRLTDDIFKQWYTRYGLAITTVNQGSQTLKDELHGWDDVSFIEPLDRLKRRQMLIDDLNAMYGEKYGFEASVGFSEPWQKAYDEWQKSADQMADGSADQSADQMADGSVDQLEGGEK